MGRGWVLGLVRWVIGIVFWVSGSVLSVSGFVSWVGEDFNRPGIFNLRASPGAASPLSSFAIRLTEHMRVFLALALIILGTL